MRFGGTTRGRGSSTVTLVWNSSIWIQRPTPSSNPFGGSRHKKGVRSVSRKAHNPWSDLLKSLVLLDLGPGHEEWELFEHQISLPQTSRHLCHCELLGY